MKVIQILPELNSGGVERGTLELGKYLVQQGHDSVIISNGGRMVEQLEKEGSRHITLPVHRKSPSSLLKVRALRKLLALEKPDILHLRSRLPAWIAWLAWRKMDAQARPRLLTTVHGFNSVNAYSQIMTRGEVIICVSESVKDYVTTNYSSVPEGKCVVIHRGVDPGQYVYGAQPDQNWLDQWHHDFAETKGKRLLTLPGRITRLKGHSDFLQILAKLPESYHGLIAGGAHAKKAEYLEQIKAEVASLGIEQKITFTGHRNDLMQILSISDIVFSLTQQPESFGRTTLEALCLGKPVIGYDHGGVGEILDELFPEGKISLGNLSGIQERITNWETQRPIPRRNNPFTLDSMLSKTVKLYESLSLKR
ncbi:MAG: glycosyltransferase family 4 protein [Verrucomicrobiota bacterium]